MGNNTLQKIPLPHNNITILTKNIPWCERLHCDPAVVRSILKIVHNATTE